MLPKRKRLAKTRDIEKTLKAKQYIFRGPLLHLVARDNELGGSRLAVAASKKLGSAVMRNRLRRLFFEAFAKISNNLEQTVDVVLYPRALAVGASLKKIKDLFTDGLKKAGIH